MQNSLTQSQVRERLVAKVEEAGSGSALAAQWGVAQSIISRVISGKEAPGPTILRRLGLRRVLRYEEYPL